MSDIALADLARQLFRTALRDPAMRAEVQAIAREAMADRDEWVRVSDCPAPQATVRRAIRAGHLPARKVGRSLMIRRGDLDTWLEAQPAQSTTEATTTEGDPLAAALESGRLRVVR